MWKRKILRKIYGTLYKYGYWWIRINQEIYNRSKSPDIVTVIKVCKFEWQTGRMD
jgi:hypothetical protein